MPDRAAAALQRSVSRSEAAADCAPPLGMAEDSWNGSKKRYQRRRGMSGYVLSDLLHSPVNGHPGTPSAPFLESLPAGKTAGHGADFDSVDQFWSNRFTDSAEWPRVPRISLARRH